MKSKAEVLEKAEQVPAKSNAVCIICGKPATDLVDGDPSCEEHIEMVYEDQVENYTQHHLADEEWLEKEE